MEECIIVRLDRFTKMFDELCEKYDLAAREAVDVAEEFLRSRAPECGFSTRREMRYYPTRSIPNVIPRLIIFFYLDEAKKTANLVSITEWPEGGWRIDEDEN